MNSSDTIHAGVRRVTTMYLRFVVNKTDEDSHQPQGLFAAAYDLLEEGDLTRDDREALREVLIWFNKNLRSPRGMTASRAVFWYKDSAYECIAQMWRLMALLEFHGYFAAVVCYRALGNVIFEDDHQVAAYPSRDDVKG